MKVGLRSIATALILTILVSCADEKQIQSEVLYNSDAYTLSRDRVKQGNNEAIVVSPTEIKSNYASPANAVYSRRIQFKFSLNEKDNELPLGTDRAIVIDEEHESEVYVFGVPSSAPVVDEPGILPVDYPFTFRLDMRPVLNQFAEKGYFEAVDGTRVAASEFKGVYIAGSSLPLSWDFVGLEEKGLKLTDADADSIYTLELKLNPKIENEDKTWKLTSDLSSKPSFHSDVPIVDALYNMALQESMLAVEPDSTFRTGAKWEGVWTRDISYSIYLAMAYMNPEVAKISLMKKVRNHRIIQDTGSGGSWPVSSDRAVWALAAWEVYLVTGDMDWLKQTYTIVKNSADDDHLNLHSPATNMYKGESSFLDWREQTYPKWMSNVDIYSSENLGTNAVHHRAHKILAQMAAILGEPSAVYEARAEGIKQGMNDFLWMEDKGYYAQYLYGRHHTQVSPRFEALGEALSVIFEIASAERAAEIIENGPLTPFGTPCIYPQIPGIPPYHNDAVWPFVQAYWNLAAAKVGNEKVLNHGLASIYRPAALFLSNYENMDVETGDYKATEINSHQMLWSIAGNIAMVHRVFLGMDFGPEKLTFHPVIPEGFGGEMKMGNFHYRNAVLDITVSGFGKEKEKVLIDGKEAAVAEISADLTGNHSIHITMNNKGFSEGGANLSANAYSPPNPIARWNGDTLRWKLVENAKSYAIYKNGMRQEDVNENFKIVSAEAEPAEYAVVAVGANGFHSFMCEPMSHGGQITTLEMEDFAGRSTAASLNYTGKGFVEISTAVNTELKIPLRVAAGIYLLDIRYANGSGHVNTDNKCALRSLFMNGNYEGPIVMPQRGLHEWSDWGYTNVQKLELTGKGDTLEISLQPWNTNMNIEVNRAMVDHIRLLRIE